MSYKFTNLTRVRVFSHAYPAAPQQKCQNSDADRKNDPGKSIRIKIDRVFFRYPGVRGIFVLRCELTPPGPKGLMAAVVSLQNSLRSEKTSIFSLRFALTYYEQNTSSEKSDNSTADGLEQSTPISPDAPLQPTVCSRYWLAKKVSMRARRVHTSIHIKARTRNRESISEQHGSIGDQRPQVYSAKSTALQNQ